MRNLAAMAPAELRAAMQGGTAGWGLTASAETNMRYVLPLPKIKARRACSCGCGGKATHAFMANGLSLGRGCEFAAYHWARTGLGGWYIRQQRELGRKGGAA